MALQIEWLERQALLLLHEESLARHGGLRGFRDEGLLDPALARPEHLFTYNSDAMLAELAAAYCYGIARNHPFNDGNERAAFAVLGLFLPANGWWLEVAQEEAFRAMMLLAAGDLTEEKLAAWISQHFVPLQPKP